MMQSYVFLSRLLGRLPIRELLPAEEFEHLRRTVDSGVMDARAREAIRYIVVVLGRQHGTS